MRPILVVDDDDAILRTIEIILSDEGYQVIVASNGKEALTCLDEHAPRLILLDMKMPIMDGWTFATTYRARPGPQAPIIVMTAAKDSEGRAAEINADAAIEKPFDIEYLIQLVKRYQM